MLRPPHAGEQQLQLTEVGHHVGREHGLVAAIGVAQALDAVGPLEPARALECARLVEHALREIDAVQLCRQAVELKSTGAPPGGQAGTAG